jgi:hypothetical protein
MIRHNHIFPDPDAAGFGCGCELKKAFMDRCIGQQFATLGSVERNEIKRRMVVLKDPVQTRWPIGHAPGTMQM